MNDPTSVTKMIIDGNNVILATPLFEKSIFIYLYIYLYISIDLFLKRVDTLFILNIFKKSFILLVTNLKLILCLAFFKKHDQLKSF